MPELPDLTVYQDALSERLVGNALNAIELASPFVLRTVTPPVAEVIGRQVQGIERLAKQLVVVLEGDYFCVIHLMIAGRLQWSPTAKSAPKRAGLAAFQFDNGSLLFTEASKKKRAALRLVSGRAALKALDPGGIEVLGVDPSTFGERLKQTHHTLKRALTDQRVLAGIGNAYSDEILLRAKLSPFKSAAKLSDEEMERLYAATQTTLTEWIELLRTKAQGKWPTKVTAFHAEMLAHGKYKSPCRVCGMPIQRIVYAENEANYCAKCQTGGKVLADRSLSRLLKDSWPKRIEELEATTS